MKIKKRTKVATTPSSSPTSSSSLSSSSFSVFQSITTCFTTKSRSIQQQQQQQPQHNSNTIENDHDHDDNNEGSRQLLPLLDTNRQQQQQHHSFVVTTSTSSTKMNRFLILVAVAVLLLYSTIISIAYIRLEIMYRTLLLLLSTAASTTDTTTADNDKEDRISSPTARIERTTTTTTSLSSPPITTAFATSSSSRTSFWLSLSSSSNNNNNIITTTPTTTSSFDPSVEGIVETSISNSTNILLYDDDSNNNNSNTKKTAVVHIGPHKTGSTTIQYFMRIVQNELLLDRYEMPNTRVLGRQNKTNHGLLAQCLKSDINRISYDTTQRKYCHLQLLYECMRIAATNNNILLSAERFASKATHPYYLRTLLSSYTTNNIYIIGYYRIYYDWVASWHNELQKKKHITDRQTILDWINDDTKLQDLLNDNYITAVVQRYKDHFSNIKIYNMHTIITQLPDDRLDINFFCNGIPNAYNTCQAILDDPTKYDSIQNEAVPLVYEELLYEAFQQQLVNISSLVRKLNYSTKRIEKLESKTHLLTTNQLYDTFSIILVPYVQAYQEHTLNLTATDFDIRICPNQTVFDTLLDISLEQEEIIITSGYYIDDSISRSSRTAREDAMRDKFNAVARTKFCSIDVRTILQTNMNGWRLFFQSF